MEFRDLRPGSGPAVKIGCTCYPMVASSGLLKASPACLIHNHNCLGYIGKDKYRCAECEEAGIRYHNLSSNHKSAQSAIETLIAQRDRLVEAVKAFGKEFDRGDGSSADSVLDITLRHFENLRELVKGIAE